MLVLENDTSIYIDVAVDIITSRSNIVVVAVVVADIPNRLGHNLILSQGQ